MFAGRGVAKIFFDCVTHVGEVEMLYHMIETAEYAREGNVKGSSQSNLES